MYYLTVIIYSIILTFLLFHYRHSRYGESRELVGQLDQFLHETHYYIFLMYILTLILDAVVAVALNIEGKYIHFNFIMGC